VLVGNGYSNRETASKGVPRRDAGEWSVIGGRCLSEGLNDEEGIRGCTQD
jgi:hypothetical protein